MTIKRQYSLPYCTLTLEGMSSDVTALGQLEQRPLLSILLNAECRFSHTAQFLKGDRTFFTSLVQAVGRYGQEFLSGIRHPQLDQDVPEIVQLATTEDKNIHRLTWHPTPESASNNGVTATNNSGTPVAIDLTTVQLFDLVDAVDQFLADSRTLPELSVPLQPVSKRYRQSEMPVSERVLPPAIGIGSLALAAALFVLIPVPKVTEPEVTTQESPAEEVITETEETEDTEESPLSGEPEDSKEEGETENLSTDTDAEDTEDTPEDELTPTSDEDSSNSTSTDNEEETESPEDRQSNSSLTEEGEDSTEDQEDEQTASNPRNIAVSSRNRNEQNRASTRASSSTNSNSNTRSSEEIKAALASATEITEPNELYYIQKYVRNRILDNWDNPGDVSRDLEYRVSVAKDGTILDYEPINGTSSGSNSLTPLPDLSYRSTNGSGVRQEEIAKLRVVFTDNGVVEISPWRGFTSQPNFASDITDREKLDELGNTLRRLIHQEWDGDVSYNRGLQYRVAVTKDGKIADYSFLNSAAGGNLDETPLEGLLRPEAAGIGTRESNSVVPQAPLAHFQVVFKPNGVLEISPW